MRITLSTLLVLLLSLLISSCENQFPTNTEDNDDFPTDTVDTLESQINTYDYIGDYEMETRVIAILADGTLEPLPEIVVDPVSIYLKDNQLYVLTYHFGMPNLDKEEPIIFLKSPNRKCISEEPTDTTTNIEDVPVEDSTMRIVMMNGFVYTIVHGAFVGSKPIVVSRINETSLEFQPSEIFKVLIVDFTGENYSTLYQHFDYKPMYRKEGKLQWDVELIMEYDNPLYWESDPLAITSIKYHNILRKKV